MAIAGNIPAIPLSVNCLEKITRNVTTCICCNSAPVTFYQIVDLSKQESGCFTRRSYNHDHAKAWKAFYADKEKSYGEEIVSQVFRRRAPKIFKKLQMEEREFKKVKLPYLTDEDITGIGEEIRTLGVNRLANLLEIYEEWYGNQPNNFLSHMVAATKRTCRRLIGIEKDLPSAQLVLIEKRIDVIFRGKGGRVVRERSFPGMDIANTQDYQKLVTLIQELFKEMHKEVKTVRIQSTLTIELARETLFPFLRDRKISTLSEMKEKMQPADVEKMYQMASQTPLVLESQAGPA